MLCLFHHLSYILPDEITAMKVEMNPTVIVRRPTLSNFTILTGPLDSPQSYEGPINLTAYLNESILINWLEPDSRNGEKQLDISIERPGTMELVFVVNNDISKLDVTKSINIAGTRRTNI